MKLAHRYNWHYAPTRMGPVGPATRKTLLMKILVKLILLTITVSLPAIAQTTLIGYVAPTNGYGYNPGGVLTSLQTDSSGNLLLGAAGDGTPQTLTGYIPPMLMGGQNPDGVWTALQVDVHGNLLTSGGGGGGGTTNTIASGTATLGTSSISSAACATVVTVSASGVEATDAIIWTPNASIKAVTGYTPSTSGGLSIAAYPTSGDVNFDVCNWSGSPITPGAVTLNWRVVR